MIYRTRKGEIVGRGQLLKHYLLLLHTLWKPQQQMPAHNGIPLQVLYMDAFFSSHSLLPPTLSQVKVSRERSAHGSVRPPALGLVRSSTANAPTREAEGATNAAYDLQR